MAKFPALRAEAWDELQDVTDNSPSSLLQALSRQQARNQQQYESLLQDHQSRLESLLEKFLAAPGAFLKPEGMSKAAVVPPEDIGMAKMQVMDLETLNMDSTDRLQSREDSVEEASFANKARAADSWFGGRGSRKAVVEPWEEGVDVPAMKPEKSEPSLLKSITKSLNMADKKDGPKSAAKKSHLEDLNNLKASIARGELSLAKRNSDGTVSGAKCAEEIVENSAFEITSSILILGNAISIGLELNWEMKNPGKGIGDTYRALNVTFLTAFTLELIMRMIAQGRSFFHLKNEALSWNMFDTILVTASFFEEIMGMMGGDINMAVMRTFRLLRAARSLRVIRVVGAFRNLRIMLRGVMSSMGPLAWAMFLFLGIMYAVAVCLLQIVSVEVAIKAQNPASGVLSAAMYDELIAYFGSLETTIYTLYVSTLGGLDWKDAAAPLLALHEAAGALFLAYMSFAYLCALNIVTSVFVENANRLTSQDDELILMDQMEQRHSWLDEVEEIFKMADVDGSGTVDLDEFREQMNDARVKGKFEKLGVVVDYRNADAIFKLLDFDGDGNLDINEFTHSLQCVQGNAKSIDVARIKSDTGKLRKEIAALKEQISSIVHALSHRQAS
mmetsp:Transcript_67205/g.118820  ORF Transcript_67205/g.118820 Transcript_67205/m.118820 type:complete len:615 (-) Transcript_67205:46-1890(-)